MPKGYRCELRAARREDLRKERISRVDDSASGLYIYIVGQTDDT